MLRRRLNHLSQLRTSADAIGDLAQVERIDAEVSEIQMAINKLQA